MSDPTPLADLRTRLPEGRAAVEVAGLGYVSLSLAVDDARLVFDTRNAGHGVKRSRATVVRL